MTVDRLLKSTPDGKLTVQIRSIRWTKCLAQ